MHAGRRTEALATWIAVAYTAATSVWYVVWRHFLAERSADEAVFENLLWNATHGHGLRSWIEGGVPHLAVHFSPVLYLLLPIHALTRSMLGVHVAVAALTATAGWFVHRHAARHLGERAAIPVMAAFLLSPTIVLQTFMEFHEQALVTLPLTLLLVSWDRGRRAAMLTSALALLTVREDNALLVLALGTLSVGMPGRRGSGAGLIALAGLWLAAWRLVVVPALGAGHLPGVFENTYAHWGDSPGTVLRAVLTQPLDVARHLTSPVVVRYLALLLAPVLFVLPFGSPQALIALPQLAMILLADPGSRVFQIRMHYSLAIVIVLYFASIDTLSRLPAAHGGLTGALRRWAPLGLAAIALLLAPGWAVRAVQRLNPHAAEAREMLASIPDTASVAAPGYLLNALATRRRLALAWGDDLPRTEFVVLEDSTRRFFAGPSVDVLWRPALDSLLLDRGYQRVFVRHGWYVYRVAPH